MRIFLTILICGFAGVSLAQDVTWIEMNKRLNQGDTLGAIFYLKDILKERKDSTWQVHFNLGLLLQKADQRDSAIHHFIRSTEQNPQLYQPHYFIGHYYFDQENMKMAIYHFSLYLNKDPENEEITHFRAQAYMKEGDFFSAVSDWTHLIKKREEPGVVFNRGLARLGMSDYASALKDFERVEEIGGSSADVYYYKGVCYMELFEENKAIKQWKTSLKSDEEYENSYFRLSGAYYDKGKLGKACEYLEKAIYYGIETSRIGAELLKACTIEVSKK